MGQDSKKADNRKNVRETDQPVKPRMQFALLSGNNRGSFLRAFWIMSNFDPNKTSELAILKTCVYSLGVNRTNFVSISLGKIVNG